MTTERYAFRMQLHPGMEAEYRRRHDEIWPELVGLLHEAGVSDYSIWLDEQTHILFGVLTRTKLHGMAALPDHSVMKSGGRIWRTSWKPIQIIRRFPQTSNPYFICHEAHCHS